MNPLDPALDVGRLAGLVFELASQLHAERMHRLTLESALVGAGVLTEDALRAAAADSGLHERGRQAARDSVAGLVRVLIEVADVRKPLRPDAHGPGEEVQA